jgi:hypothetical protein
MVESQHSPPDKALQRACSWRVTELITGAALSANP